jgi:hypothetical protein
MALAMTTTYSGVERRHVLVFDRTTTALLGEEDVLLGRAGFVDVEPPVIDLYATYASLGTVQTLP